MCGIDVPEDLDARVSSQSPLYTARSYDEESVKNCLVSLFKRIQSVPASNVEFDSYAFKVLIEQDFLDR